MASGLALSCILAAEPARTRCEKLMLDGVLAKDTHETTIRLAPPLVIEQDDLDLAIDKLLKVLAVIRTRGTCGSRKSRR